MKLIIAIFKYFRPLLSTLIPDRRKRFLWILRRYESLPAGLRKKVGYSDTQYPLAIFALVVDDVFFIQIGANDGTHADPLNRHILNNNWSGILIEPVPHLFQRLNKTYASLTNLTYEQVAIAEHDGTTDFHRTVPSDDKQKYESEGLGSLKKDILIQTTQHSDDLSEHIITERVNCLTLSSLLAKHTVNRLDLIQVDTEGFDYDIIKQLDFTKFCPTLIIYEHKHLSHEDKKSCEQLLLDHEYTLISDQNDTLAYR